MLLLTVSKSRPNQLRIQEQIIFGPSVYLSEFINELDVLSSI